MQTYMAVVKKDLLGCFDVLALKQGAPPVFIQIAARGDYAPHLRKMCGNDPAPDNRMPRRDNVRRVLSVGAKVCIHLWDQPDGRLWRGEVKWIEEGDMEMVAKRARKR